MAPTAAHQEMARVRAHAVLGDITNLGNAACISNFAAIKPAAPVAGKKPKGGNLKVDTGDLVMSDSNNGLVDTLMGDSHVVSDPQWVQDYAADVHALLRQETISRPRHDYMEGQFEINAKMRAILIDWIVEVHMKYKQMPETLYLTVHIVDRYLERKCCARNKLQLVGVTAMLIASKFEEIFPPEISTFEYISDKACTQEEIMDMEMAMLRELDYRVSQPTAAHFLGLYQRENCCSPAEKELVCYLMELTLLDIKMIRHHPSLLVSSAIYLSNKLLRKEPAWPEVLFRKTGFNEDYLVAPAREICQLYESAETNSLQAVRKKYAQPQHQQVAKLRF